MVFGYFEGVPLLFKELLCKLSILDLCSTLTFCTWCVLLLFYDILSIWFITIVPTWASVVDHNVHVHHLHSHNHLNLIQNSNLKVDLNVWTHHLGCLVHEEVQKSMHVSPDMHVLSMAFLLALS
jgi:hypothetical protein